MTIDRKQLKSEAKQAMAAARPAPFWVALALIAITLILNILAMSLDGTLSALRVMYAEALEGRLTYVQPRAAGGLLGWLLGVAVQVMFWELAVGFVLYSMRVWRRQKAGVGDLFDSFGVFFQAIWIQLLPNLLVGLWMMVYALPVSTMIMLTGQAWWSVLGLPLMIPALRALYSYRLAAYVMLDDPSRSCWQCVQRSRQMMLGHRWEAFVLDLSFLGWGLLCLIPVIGLVLMVWVAAYQQVTDAGFYERVAGVWAAENAPFPGPQPPEF